MKKIKWIEKSTSKYGLKNRILEFIKRSDIKLTKQNETLWLEAFKKALEDFAKEVYNSKN